MLREEFNKIYQSMSADELPVLTDDEYKCIEFVYNWHPCNFSKESIVFLYAEFGMCIIYDLLPRANLAMEHDADISRARLAVENAQDHLKCLLDQNIKTKEALESWLQN